MNESRGISNFNENSDKSHSSSSSDPYSSEIPDVERYVETVVLSVIALLSGVANMSLWIVILGTKSLRQHSSMLLLLCLSLADVLVSCVSMPTTAVTVALSRWVFGKEMCTVMGFLNMLTLVCSVMSLGLISINRYIRICRSLYYRRLFSSRRIFFMTFGVWCLSAVLSSLPLLGWSRYNYLSGQSFCFCDWRTSVSYTFFMVIVCFGGPVFMMTVCNVRILQTFRESKHVLQSYAMTTSSANVIVRNERVSIPGEQSIAEEEKENRNIDRSLQKVSSVSASPEPVPTMPQEDTAAEAASDDEMTSLDLKAVNLASGSNDVPQVNTPAPSNTKQAVNLHSGSMLVVCDRPRYLSTTLKVQRKEKQRAEDFQLALSLMVVVAVFVICWLPFCITMFISVYAPHSLPRAADMFTLLLGYSNSCVNPIIYGVRNKRVKEGYKDLWRTLTTCCRACGRKVGSRNLSYQRRSSIPIGSSAVYNDALR